VSENGPREGIHDLPRPAPEAGRRAIDEESTAGAAYGTLSRSLRRRRAELVELVEAGATPAVAAASYQRDHPLEPGVTVSEIEIALESARASTSKRAEGRPGERRSRPPHSRSAGSEATI
jgi:hypothetical protein